MSDKNLQLLNAVSGRDEKIYKHAIRRFLNRLSAAPACIISPGENRRELGHVPQLFAMLVWHCRPSVVSFLVDRAAGLREAKRSAA